MERMIATRTFTYAGAKVEPGEQFFARSAHAPFLQTTRRAKPYSVGAAAYQRRDMQAEATPVHAQVSEIDDLRAQYETRFGNRPDRRWKEARLRAELGKVI